MGKSSHFLLLGSGKMPQTTPPPLNLHAIMPSSRANGPGCRTVIWLQGCSLRCPGCFNPGTHPSDPRETAPVEALLDRLNAAQRNLEGITISGGEPLEQPQAVLHLLQGVRATTRLSIILFSGHTLEEIRRIPLGPRILSQVDVLIDGRFDESKRLATGLRGSENQRIHLLSDRYSIAEIERTPCAEVSIDAAGNTLASGIHPLSIS